MAVEMGKSYGPQFDAWEQEFRAEDTGRTMVLPPMPRRAASAPVRHGGAGSRAERRAERRRNLSEWVWGIVGGVGAAAPVLAVVWMHSGR